MSKNSRIAICAVLVYALTVSPLLLHAQQAVRVTEAGAANPLLRYVPETAVVAAIARPRRVLTHESMATMPIEVLSAGGKQEFGLDPLDIESALLVIEPPLAGPPEIGLVLQARDKSATLKMEQGPPFVFAADGTIIAASSAELGERLKARSGATLVPLADKLTAASPDLAVTIDMERLRPLAQAAMAHAPPLPPPVELLKQAPPLLRRIDVQLQATQNPAARLGLVANNDADAQRLEQLLNQAMQGGREMLLQQLGAEAQSDDPVAVASRQYATRMMDSVLTQLRPRRDGANVVFAAEGTAGNQVAMTGVLVALLLPAVQAAREAARRTQAMNQLKQLSIAMLVYQDAQMRFPARASFDAQGKPLLSWRVHVLPYLEQMNLYKQFHLDEPWDSAHNRTLIQQMPEVFANPNRPRDGKTNYLVAVGPGTAFEGKEGVKLSQIVDGTSNTLMLFEADDDRAVPWTQPEDLAFDPDRPRQGLGSFRHGGFLAARCDGSVTMYSTELDEQLLRALFTIAGQDTVPPN